MSEIIQTTEKKVPSMDQLPIELYSLIFRDLNPKYLVKLRGVCKSWKNGIDWMRVHSLVIITKARFDNQFYYSGVPINATNAFDLDVFGLSALKIQRSLTSLSLFGNLKCLQIAAEIRNDEQLQPYLTRFQSLEQLEIQYSETSELYLINHPNLKILLIYDVHDVNQINICCPRLEVLRLDASTTCKGGIWNTRVWDTTWVYSGIKIALPETILHLRLAFYKSDALFDLAKFPSLQYLHCDWNFPSFNLSDHPQLKEIRAIRISTYSSDGATNKARFVDTFEQKERLKRDDLKIYWRNELHTIHTIQRLFRIL